MKNSSYDEVFDSQGYVRRQYEITWKGYCQRRSKQQDLILDRLARKAFDWDAPVLPFPRILTQLEYRTIAQGVSQRGRALQIFLHDHYFGKKEYLKQNILTQTALDRIVQRNQECQVSSILRSESLQFWYAPDIIRDAQGRFRVLEDNLGFVGGLGDLHAISQAAQSMNYDPNLLKSQPDPIGFYSQMAQNYQKQAKLYGDGQVVMISYHPHFCNTHEDQRLERIMENCGIRSIRTSLKNGISPSKASLVTKDNSVYLRSYQGRNSKIDQSVGFVILNIDHADIEPTHHSVSQRFKDQRVPRLDPIGTPGFWSSVAAGRVGVNHSPGFEFVNDKEFYLYVDRFIEFYLKEEAILPGIETLGLFSETELLFRLNSVFEDIDRWVIKGVDGRGGEQVWLGNRLSKTQIKKLKSKVAKNPSHYVAQKLTPLSTLLDHYLDIRIHAVIGVDSVLVSPIPWGRASPVSGNGKVNISDRGCLSIVLVEPSLEKRKIEYECYKVRSDCSRKGFAR